MTILLAICYLSVLFITLYLSNKYERDKSLCVTQGVQVLDDMREWLFRTQNFSKTLHRDYVERNFMHTAESLIYLHNQHILSKNEFEPLFGDKIRDNIHHHISTHIQTDYPMVIEYVRRSTN